MHDMLHRLSVCLTLTSNSKMENHTCILVSLHFKLTGDAIRIKSNWQRNYEVKRSKIKVKVMEVKQGMAA